MWVLLFLVGFLGFIVAVGALLWSFIKKNKELRKKSLIGGLLAMIMFFTGVMISPTDDSDSSAETPKTEQTSKTSSTSKKEEKNSTKQSKKKVAKKQRKLAHLQKQFLAHLAHHTVQAQAHLLQVLIVIVPQVRVSHVNIEML